MKKGTITGVVAGTMITGGFCLYDKLKDGEFTQKIKSSLRRLLDDESERTEMLRKDEAYKELEKEFKETYKNILEVQITLDEIKDVIANNNGSDHLETMTQLDSIKDSINEIKTMLSSKKEEK